MSQPVKRHWPKREIIIGVLALIATVALCVVPFYYKQDLIGMTSIASYSLLGMLIISFIAGSMAGVTAIPVPYWLLAFTLPSALAPHWGIWAPVWVGITSALGCTLGHIPTFMIGYGSRSLSKEITSKINNRFYDRAIAWAKKHGSWAVFAMSAMFNPIHLPMTVAIGALHFPPLKFLFFSFLGNAVKSLFLAFCGYFGLTSLFRFLGA